MSECDGKPEGEQAICLCESLVKRVNESLDKYDRDSASYNEFARKKDEWRNLRGKYGEDYNRYKQDLSRWEFGWQNVVAEAEYYNNRHDDWCRNDAQKLKNKYSEFPDVNDWEHKIGNRANDKDTIHNSWRQPDVGARGSEWGDNATWGFGRGRCKLTDGAIDKYARARLTEPTTDNNGRFWSENMRPQVPDAPDIVCCGQTFSNIQGQKVDISRITQNCGNNEDKPAPVSSGGGGAGSSGSGSSSGGNKKSDGDKILGIDSVMFYIIIAMFVSLLSCSCASSVLAFLFMDDAA